jgi:hypothetical protein
MEREYRVIDRKTYPAKLPDRGCPTVRFDCNNGVVYFSLRACILMELKEGDRVVALQDTRDPSVIGFKKTSDELGFKVRGKRAGLSFAAAGLTRQVTSIFGKKKGVTVQIGREKRDGAYWLISPSAR